MKFGNTGELPPVAYGAHLVRALWQCGPVTGDGAPIAWTELESYSRMSGERLDTWEAATLRAMSEAYAVYARKARKSDCPSPWRVTELPRSEVSTKVLAFFRPIAKKPTDATTGGIKQKAQRIPRQRKPRA